MLKKIIPLEELRSAQGRLKGRIKETPLLQGDEILNPKRGKLYLKAENFQRTGSFKIRGAMNKLLLLSDEEKKKGVVVASSGNHGLAVAFAAKELGIEATIVMPVNVVKIKREKTQSLGGKIILHGKTSEERYQKVFELMEDYGLSLVHSYDDEELMAGQGTIGLEVLEALDSIDRIIVPVGGGGLLSGIASAVKHLKPSVEVIGVETSAVPRYTKSLEHGGPVKVPMEDTWADGLRVVEPGKIGYSIIENLADRIITVGEESIKQGVKDLFMKGKIVAEPSAALGLAAIYEEKIQMKASENTVILISGGNVDENRVLEIFS